MESPLRQGFNSPPPIPVTGPNKGGKGGGGKGLTPFPSRPKNRGKGGGGGSTSTQWAIFARAPQTVSQAYVTLSEATFKAGGVDITVGGVASSIGPWFGSLTASYLFDKLTAGNNRGSQRLCDFAGWTNANLPGTITTVLPTAAAIDTLALYSRSSTLNQEVTGFRLERSDNAGVDWVVHDTWATPNTWSYAERREFAVTTPVSSTHWRVIITTGDNIAILGELELIESGVVRSRGIVPTVSPALNYGSADKFHDGDGWPAWVYTFVGTVSPDELVLTAATTDFPQAPTDVSIRYKSGDAWIETARHTGLTWTSGSVNTLAVVA